MLLMTVSRSCPCHDGADGGISKGGRPGESLAAAIYSGSFLLMSLVFSGMNRHILFSRSNYLSTRSTSRRRGGR